MATCMTIGIAGGTGSGKTTITRRLVEAFGSDVTVLYHDNYYKAHDDLPYADRAKLNYDHPNAFDTELMARQLAQLRAGQTVRCPVYDYTIHNRSGETLEVPPARVILVEGILIFESALLRDQMDIKLYVDTDADVRILRRIVRDVRDRGRSLESVVNQYLEHRQAHARAVRRAQQALRRPHHPRGRAQHRRPRDGHAAHRRVSAEIRPVPSAI